MNEQTRFLAERLMGWRKEEKDGVIYYYKDGDRRPQFVILPSGIPVKWHPQTNPAHSRMVLDAMVERGYTPQIDRRDGDNMWRVWFHKDDHKKDFIGYARLVELDQAICDAAEQTLRSEEE